MKRIHVILKPLPRIWRIALCVLAAAMLLFAVYTVSGYPAFSPEQALRRAERRALISVHGEVLSSEPQILYNNNKARLLVVEYGNAAAGFYGVSQDSPLKLGWGAHNTDCLYLFPKSADGVTVAACPGYPRYMAFSEGTLVIAAFDNCPEAVRAELCFTLTPSASFCYPDAVPISYALSAEREHEGVFLFLLETPADLEENSPAQYALQCLSECVDPWSAQIIPGTFDGGMPSATVTFYDDSGNMVASVKTKFAQALV